MKKKINQEKKERTILIAGAGLVGSLLGLSLSKRGHKVTLLEKQAQEAAFSARQRDFSGSSINLALSERGLKPLRDIGVHHEILKLCVPMYGRVVHPQGKTSFFQAYDRNLQAIYSLSRSRFIHALLHLAQKEKKIQIHFNSPLENIDLENRKAFSGHKTFHFDFLVGTDGAFSSVRQILEKKKLLQVSLKKLDHSYKELILRTPQHYHPKSPLSVKHKENQHHHFISPNGKKNVSFESHPSLMFQSLHIWPRTHYMMVALPNLNSHFTGTLFMPLKGKLSFESFKSSRDITNFFSTELKNISSWIQNKETLLRTHLNPLMSVTVHPWFFEDKILLMGDSAHAVLPFLGQGMNAGFEDVNLFVSMLEKHKKENLTEKKSLKTLFESFFQSRFNNACALSQMSEDNYNEMRNEVEKDFFLLKKQVDFLLEKQFPEKYQSIYRLLAFSHTPYQDIYRRQKVQNKILGEVCKGVTAPKQVNFQQAGILIERNVKDF